MDKDAGVRVGDLKLRSAPQLKSDTRLYDMLRLFETGRCHLAVLVQAPGKPVVTGARHATYKAIYFPQVPCTKNYSAWRGAVSAACHERSKLALGSVIRCRHPLPVSFMQQSTLCISMRRAKALAPWQGRVPASACVRNCEWQPR